MKLPDHVRLCLCCAILDVDDDARGLCFQCADEIDQINREAADEARYEAAMEDRYDGRKCGD